MLSQKPKSQKEKEEDLAWVQQFLRDMDTMYEILREIKWDPVCAKTRHKYMFCTQCTKDLELAKRRFRAFEKEFGKVEF